MRFNSLVTAAISSFALIGLTAAAPIVESAPPSTCTSTCTMDGKHMSMQFMGVKANTGNVTHTVDGTKHMLSLSGSFQIPDAPAPHWQLVDSKGNTYLLQRLKIKGDKENRSIEVPPYVADIAKVQIWCAWAETLLGEASFEHVVMTGKPMGKGMAMDMPSNR
jgi:hypothetical protein